MRAVIICVQVLIGALVAVSAMPLVFVAFPEAQSRPGFGLGLMGGLFLLTVVGLSLLWPRRKE